MKNIIYPFDPMQIMKKRRSLKKSLFAGKKEFAEKKIAILGGSTTSDIKDTLEVFLLDAGITPFFYESGYNSYYEESMFDNPSLSDFAPDIIYLHVTIENIKQKPLLTDSEDTIKSKIAAVFTEVQNICENLLVRYNASIIINNFAFPDVQYLGNIDSIDIHGYNRFVTKINQLIYDYARDNNRIFLNDICYLSARIGLDKWYDRDFWYSYKMAVSYECIPELAYNICKIIKASLGKSKKCLVLDLDNTLWGGTIGDDGMEGIKIGKETPSGEAYTAFQQYILGLKEKGVILAVCSKNDLQIAKEGFLHPDTVLKIDDFAAFEANWDEKYLNIIKIAEKINIGLDSVVFVDDNPVERMNVRTNLPEVAVPEINGDDVSSYVKILDQSGYFEQINVSEEDLKRTRSYHENAQRQELQKQFVSYDDFLRSLDMKAEIKPFSSIYMDRIAQLVNKTNQFNLTSKRYTLKELDDIACDPSYLTLYGRLKDKFGDNGLISVIIGRKSNDILHIELWLMSCRVIKRDMEKAMFDILLKTGKDSGIEKIIGHYYKTNRNAMVKDLYKNLGFCLADENIDGSVWEYDLKENKRPEHHIHLG